MLRAVIMTALRVEYLAVRQHLADLKEETHPQGNIYERGSFVANGQTWEVGIFEAGAGDPGTAAETVRIIEYFKPDVLFFVGIAGGIKDLAIGDVVAATDVYYYESGKAEENQFRTRPKGGKSSFFLVQRAKAEARKDDWRQRLTKNVGVTPNVLVAPIVAGEKVVASRKSDVFQLIRASYNDAIAVEMEGYGFLSAAFSYPEIKSIVIRGISDLVEGKNDDSEESEDIRQARASRHASAFAFEVLSKLEIAAPVVRSSSQDSPGTVLNSPQQQRLQQKQEALQSEWNIRSEKLKDLRQALAIESGTSVKFQLKQQVQAEETQLQKLEAGLEAIEQELNPPANEPSPSVQAKEHNVPSGQQRRSKSPNFFSYDANWVGREELVRRWSDRLQSSYRLLVLVGITGIGKTALGERLSIELADWLGDWSHYHQEDFDQDTADFASVAARWLEKWGELVTPDDRKDPQRLLNRLVKHLQENRYIVQMDSLEYILEGNEKDGWSNFKDEWWTKFFAAYLKIDFCESCLILTSQDLPGQLKEIGTRYQNFWDCEPLSGLEPSERISLFDKMGLDILANPTYREYLERIGQAYEGHPLALRVIAGEIKGKPFEGNVKAYWKKYGIEIEEVEQAIIAAQAGSSDGADDKWQLHRFTKSLRDHVLCRLNKTFERLKKEAPWAYLLLCEAAVYRCSVPEEFWLSHLEDWEQNEAEQKLALELLFSRNLVQSIINSDDEFLLSQHNLIRGLSLERLENLQREDFIESSVLG